MKTLDQLVEEWNESYDQLGREIRVKDMSDNDYEETISYMLHDVAGSWEKALEIFLHENNNGGWMMGDAHGFIVRKIEEQQ